MHYEYFIDTSSAVYVIIVPKQKGLFFISIIMHQSLDLLYIQGQLDLGFGQVKPEPHKLQYLCVDKSIFYFQTHNQASKKVVNSALGVLTKLLSAEIHFPIGGKRVTCCGSKLPNSLGKQHELSTRT